MDVEGDIDHEQNLIQQQMEETRASLSTKLEALETHVAETVQTATDAVQTTKDVVADTVETVKDSVGEIRDKVGETVRSVADFFDIKAQAQERPWVVLGGSLGLGCLLGWYLTSGRGAKRAAASAHAAATAPRQAFAEYPPAQPTAPQPAAAPAAEAPKPSWIGKEVGRLRGLAIGVAMGSLRDLVKQTLPEAFGGRIAEEVDKLTPEFGGEVFQGQILPDLKGLSDLLAPKPKPGAADDFREPETEAKREKAYAGGLN